MYDFSNKLNLFFYKIQKKKLIWNKRLQELEWPRQKPISYK